MATKVESRPDNHSGLISQKPLWQSQIEEILERSEKPEFLSQTDIRNSYLRVQTASLVHNTTLILHKVFPSLTPNQVTLMGVVEVLAATLVAEQNNLSKKPSLLINILSFLVESDGYLKDAQDGALARIIMAETPGKHNGANGQIIDVLADRAEEIGGALLRSHTAYRMGNIFGERAAMAVAVTSTLPSLSRAYAEFRGYVVPEMGRNVLEAAGTRFGRIALSSAATHLRNIGGINLQPPIDTLSATANLYSAIKRIGVIYDPNTKPTLKEKYRIEAANRLNVLSKTELAALVATLATYKISRLIYPEQNPFPIQ